MTVANGKALKVRVDPADEVTVFGRKKRAMSSGSGELRAQVSRTQASMGSLDPAVALPAPDATELTPLAPSARDLQGNLDASEAELTKSMAELTAATSKRLGTAVTIRPYLMLPAECWDTDHQRMLIETLGLTPTEPWNVLPLAATPADAEALGISQHPMMVSPVNVEQAQKFVDEIIVAMLATFEVATFGGGSVDTDALGEARQTARTEIMAIAQRMASIELGADVVEQARGVFATT